MARHGLSFKNARRLEEIFVVLVRFGFADWVQRLRHSRLVRALTMSRDFRGLKERREDLDRDRFQRIRLALEALGPTFVKFGQILSNRSDLLPAALIEELAKLQDQVPPFDIAQVRETVRLSLGRPIEEVFTVFEAVPVASASIAQVHEAYLPEGIRVAVKIQRPKIEPVILRDLEVLALLARLVERYLAELRHFDPVGMVEEFRKQILRELDFGQELSNMERFAQLFAKSPSVHVPKPFRSYSSRQILTMEFVQGIRLSALIDGPQAGYDRALIASRLAESMLEQIFHFGFFHADPHPGNIMILPGNVACFLDFGMVGRIHPDERKILVELLGSMASQDYRRVSTELLRLVGQSTEDMASFELEISELMELYMERPLKELDIAEVIQRMVGIVRSYNIKVPGKFLLMGKALMISEGIGSRLSPDFNLMGVFEPFARRLAIRRLSPERIAARLLADGKNYLDAFRDFPVEGMALLRAAKRGEFQINFKLKGIEPLRQTIENVATRLIFGITLAAILISSSLIIRADVPPLVNGMPVIGLVGFGIAGLMSLGFLVSIIARLIQKAGKGE